MQGSKNSSGKKILVTGAAGFLGSHLCNQLLMQEPNIKVLGVDNLYSGLQENIAGLLKHPQFEFQQHDIILPFDAEVDEIYNLACPASPVHYQNDPVRTLKTSVIGAANMLDLAKKRGAKILQASTSEVYGNPEVSPQKETYWGNVNPVGIRSCYDEGKRAAETLFYDYRRQHLIDTRVMRIFNTYGPNMHPNDGRVVSNFMVQAMRNQPVTIYGDGSQTRSFCYVDDTISAMISLMNSSSAEQESVNIGNPHEITIKQLANTIISLTGSSSPIEYQPLPGDDPVQRCPDITKARQLLNWEPTVGLEEGLSKTIQYFDEILSTNADLLEAAQ